MIDKKTLAGGVATVALCLFAPMAASATTIVNYPRSTVRLTDTWLTAPTDVLTRSVDGNVAYFTLKDYSTSAVVATFTTPFGLPSAPGDVFSDHVIVPIESASWNTETYKYLIFWMPSRGAGFTVGTGPDDNSTTLYKFFEATQPVYGSGQVYSFGVPEPATWTLMLIGVGGLGASLRRANKRAVPAS